MDDLRILQGSAIEKLKELDDQSIQTVVTSPPYWGLRNYNVDGQLGLEATPQEYVQKLVEIFREIRRVLKDDGTVWLNLGDSYAGSRPMGTSDNEIDAYGTVNKSLKPTGAQGKLVAGLKPKDLVGIPWRVAFALQEDGWYLRQDIIWNKPNPMPESVLDRCTKSHEYIFLLSKSERYYYDHEAIKEPTVRKGAKNTIGGTKYPGTYQNKGVTKNRYEDMGLKNKRSVWNITTKPYKAAHFATFPTELPETCIKAGTRENDVVLDPFAGAGTTGLVALKNKRHAVLIELNPEYIELIDKRVSTYQMEF